MTHKKLWVDIFSLCEDEPPPERALQRLVGIFVDVRTWSFFSTAPLLVPIHLDHNISNFSNRSR